jgi:hypothetical protein
MMGVTTNTSKQKWNAAHYTQVKISVNPGLASAFKDACAASGVSMASALSRFMADYCRIPVKQSHPQDYSTRRQRRESVEKILDSLTKIREAEETYADNMPENLRNSIRYEAAEQSIEALDEASSILSQAY